MKQRELLNVLQKEDESRLLTVRIQNMTC